MVRRAWKSCFGIKLWKYYKVYYFVVTLILFLPYTFFLLPICCLMSRYMKPGAEKHVQFPYKAILSLSESYFSLIKHIGNGRKVDKRSLTGNLSSNAMKWTGCKVHKSLLVLRSKHLWKNGSIGVWLWQSGEELRMLLITFVAVGVCQNCVAVRAW